MTTAELITDNAARWAKMAILPNRLLEVEKVSAALVAPNAKAIYQQAQAAVPTVPWWFVAIVHEREASQNFRCSIAQGDPWNEISTHVPRGIGPFTSFVAAAVFTLTRCSPYPAKWTDWTIGGVLTLFESYNGTGYEDYHNEPSPYDWGATSIEKIGKYVADGKFSATTWDSQIGCAAILKQMMVIDPSIITGAIA